MAGLARDLSPSLLPTPDGQLSFPRPDLRRSPTTASGGVLDDEGGRRQETGPPQRPRRPQGLLVSLLILCFPFFFIKKRSFVWLGCIFLCFDWNEEVWELIWSHLRFVCFRGEGCLLFAAKCKLFVGWLGQKGKCRMGVLLQFCLLLDYKVGCFYRFLIDILIFNFF